MPVRRHDKTLGARSRVRWLTSGEGNGDLDLGGTEHWMEDQLAECWPELALVGEEYPSDQVDSRVLRVESDRLIAIGQGSGEVIRVPQDPRTKDVRGRRLGIQPDHGTGVL